MERAVILAAARAEATSLATALSELDEHEFDRPTGCEPWTVRQLLGHVLAACRRLPVVLEAPAPPEAMHSALQYFRNDRRGGTTDSTRIDEAVQLSATFGPGDEIVAALVAATEEMIELANREPPERIVRTPWDDVMTLDDYLETRVVELAVHGVDLAFALERDPWISQRAAAVTAEVLTEEFEPDELRDAGWNPTTLIAKSTGRWPLSDAEAAQPWRAKLLWPRP